MEAKPEKEQKSFFAFTADDIQILNPYKVSSGFRSLLASEEPFPYYLYAEGIPKHLLQNFVKLKTFLMEGAQKVQGKRYLISTDESSVGFPEDAILRM